MELVEGLSGTGRNSYRERREAEISVLQRELHFVRKAVGKLRIHSEACTDQRGRVFRLLDAVKMRTRTLAELESEISIFRPALGPAFGCDSNRPEISDLRQTAAELKNEKLLLLKKLSDLEISVKTKVQEISAVELKLQQVGTVGEGLSEGELLSEISSAKNDCEQLKITQTTRAAEISAQISGLERELAQLRSAGEPTITTAASSREAPAGQSKQISESPFAHSFANSLLR